MLFEIKNLLILFLLVVFQINHDLVVFLFVELIEAEAYAGHYPQYTRYGAKGMVHDAQYLRVLHGVAYISCISQGDGEERGYESHAYLVAQGYEGVLESVISDSRLPLAILHAVGDDGIDGGVEAREEEPGQRREQVEHDGTASRACRRCVRSG